MSLEDDIKIVREQIGREPRGMVKVVYRNAIGEPVVVQTAPWVTNKQGKPEPFPTMYYLTHPDYVKAASRLEASGKMKDFEALIDETSPDFNADVAKQYAKAHRQYIDEREVLAKELNMNGLQATHADFSAGGMPTRVKCLHALLGHALAAGPGVNPIGDRVRQILAADPMFDKQGEIADQARNDEGIQEHSGGGLGQNSGQSEPPLRHSEPPIRHSEPPLRHSELVSESRPLPHGQFEIADQARNDEGGKRNDECGHQPVAAIDCGTNSIRLLIANVDEKGKLYDVQERKTRINRLGYGVDKTHQFADEALQRTFEIEEEYALDLQKLKISPSNIRFVATSASRDAKNRDVFFSKSEEILGVTPEVITGDEEARLSFSGVTSAISEVGRNIVIDLGGGSTEIIVGETGVLPSSAGETGANADDAAQIRGSKVLGEHSMNIGSVRLTERHFERTDSNWQAPPTAKQLEAATADADQAISDAFAVLADKYNVTPVADSVFGVAGTVTTITAHALNLPAYSRQAVSGVKLTLEQTFNSCDAILAATRDELVAMPFMHPGRVDVIQAGALIWKVLLQRLSTKSSQTPTPLTHTITSEHDILDGIALSILE